MDDSQPTNKFANVFDVDSHMYSKQYENLENYDCHQLAIILLQIWECKDFDYHKGCLECLKSEIGKELKECFDAGRKPNLDKLQTSKISKNGMSTEGHLTKKRVVVRLYTVVWGKFGMKIFLSEP